MESKSQKPLPSSHAPTRMLLDQTHKLLDFSTFASSRTCNDEKTSNKLFKPSREAVVQQHQITVFDDERMDEDDTADWNTGGVFRERFDLDVEEEQDQRDDTHIFSIKKASPIASQDDQRDSFEHYERSEDFRDEHKAWEEATSFVSPERTSRLPWAVETEERRIGV